MAISREDIRLGMEELGIESDEEKDEHFSLIISALSGSKDKLGF